MPPKLFRFTHFPKNTSATSLESHTFKTKDLKPFRFIHFQERVVGGGAGASPSSRHSPLDMNHCFLLSPLYSALTRFPLFNSFRIFAEKRGGGGEGGDNPARIVILSERSESKDPSATSSEYGAILRTETEPWIVKKSSASLFALSGATNCAPR